MAYVYFLLFYILKSNLSLNLIYCVFGNLGTLIRYKRIVKDEESLSYSIVFNKKAKLVSNALTVFCLSLYSPTFYLQLLRTSVSLAAFLCLRFRFVLYWCKTVGVKAAHITLMKLNKNTLLI